LRNIRGLAPTSGLWRSIGKRVRLPGVRRRLFTILSALSLLLRVAMIAAWARSDTHRDARRFVWWGHDYAIASERGTLGIDNEENIADFEKKKWDETEAAWAQDRAIPTDDSEDFATHTAIHKHMMAIFKRQPPAPFRMSVPYWMLIAISAILPALWCVQFHRRCIRIAVGQCALCGYDVRATPQRCPECGTAVVKIAR
jgi:hypothetical protein